MSGIIAQNAGRHTGLVKAASAAGVWNLIETITADDDATITFSSGIDSTYGEYVFTFTDIHPANDSVKFTVNFRDGSTAYDATKTSNAFSSYHYENAAYTNLSVNTGQDLAQSTDAQQIIYNIFSGSIEDASVSGKLHLFAPSDTTFVKHFFGQSNHVGTGDDPVMFSETPYIGGYCNVTAAIDGVQFAMSAGNIDAGTISLYGIT